LWVPTFLIATPMIRSRHVIQLVKMEPLLARYTVPSILKWNTQYNRVWQQERRE
jgi:hypothetical protein